MERSSGILMHISSLPNRFGIGSIGQCAYDFVDFLAEAKQRYWQILPLGPTGYGDSPYQLFSASAGNPYFIDLDLLVADGLLLEEEVAAHLTAPGPVDYGRLYQQRFPLLRKAFARGRERDLGSPGRLWGGARGLAGRLRPVHGPKIPLRDGTLFPMAGGCAAAATGGPGPAETGVPGGRGLLPVPTVSFLHPVGRIAGPMPRARGSS